jgi:hypothetical protein
MNSAGAFFFAIACNALGWIESTNEMLLQVKAKHNGRAERCLIEWRNLRSAKKSVREGQS